MLKFLFSTKGRTRRIPYAAFVVPPIIVIWGIGEVLAGLASTMHMPAYSLSLMSLGVAQLLLVWPTYTLSIRRLHDLNWPEFPALLILSSLVMAVLYLLTPLVVPMVELETGVFSEGYRTAKAGLDTIGKALWAARLAFIVVLCLIPGTKGPNRFDPVQPDDSVFE
ncbi:DUF805 domain-containing protein [Asticcacaulis sp. YBE204]|uniref:DUF805 domain-containing protein n=1 Tax=Asticcacaulis sp. YBE204 TaxID=1282363 RepID=UPI0003C41242|nr:DUF805 domain-containing protein [Asticcacaulis sp. YBE204]ESQ80506.1 hypothetical protein AEYBE204_04365 [Asticcacaulis sp. YBE204]